MRAVVVAAAIVALAASASAQSRLADDRSRREALQHYRDGQDLLSHEQFEDAAERFRKATVKDPLLTLAHYGRGQSYMALRRYASAIKAFKECLEAFRILHALQQESRFEVEKRRDDEIHELHETQRRFEQLARATPGAGYQLRAARTEQRMRDLERQKTSIGGAFQPPAEVLLALGSAYFRNGDRSQAEHQWSAAVEANSKLGEAHNNLAIMYLQTGRKPQALAALRAAEAAGYRVHPQVKDDVSAMPD